MSKPTLGSVSELTLSRLVDSLWAGSLSLDDVTVEWLPEVQALGEDYNRYRLRVPHDKELFDGELRERVYEAWIPGVCVWRHDTSPVVESVYNDYL